MTQHLLFNAAGLDLAAPANVIKAIHEELEVQPVAGTKRWFAGLAVAHGKLLPVTDIGAYSGRRSSTGRTLELSQNVGIAGLRVDNVVGLSESLTSDVSVQGSGLNSRELSKLALTGQAIAQDEHTFFLLDIAALVQSPDFLNIAETDV